MILGRLKVKGQELAIKVKASLCVEGHCDSLLFKYDYDIDNAFMKHSLFIRLLVGMDIL